MNICISYCYRDGSNYKNYGKAVCTNQQGLSLQAVKTRLQDALIEGTWFVASEWGLKELHIFSFDAAIDHEWSELNDIEETDSPADSDDIAALLQHLLTKSLTRS